MSKEEKARDDLNYLLETAKPREKILLGIINNLEERLTKIEKENDPQ